MNEKTKDDKGWSEEIPFLSKTCERRNKTYEINRCLDKKKYEKKVIPMKRPKVDSYIDTYKLFDMFVSGNQRNDHFPFHYPSTAQQRMKKTSPFTKLGYRIHGYKHTGYRKIPYPIYYNIIYRKEKRYLNFSSRILEEVVGWRWRSVFVSRSMKHMRIFPVLITRSIAEPQ